MSAHVIDKAQCLLDEGRVAEYGTARVFRVLGDGGTPHTAVISDTGASCSCAAGQRGVLCSHLVAAGVLVDREQVAT